MPHWRADGQMLNFSAERSSDPASAFMLCRSRDYAALAWKNMEWKISPHPASSSTFPHFCLSHSAHGNQLRNLVVLRLILTGAF